ncbi:hypothetical protein [Streptosporangium sp. NPDC051022]|uniref:hypothetical protein n=1 Tax=Streptosporangium sp. NPDC051022 TaxID=3155752 RepID=UPI0034251860
MRQWIALVTAALAAPALITASPAAAQTTSARATSSDPASALERQLRPEHGVQITETNRVSLGAAESGSNVVKTRSASPGSSGAVAGREILTRLLGEGEPAVSQRRIVLGEKSRLSGGVQTDRLPRGGTRTSATGKQVVNVLEPDTLRFLVREAQRSLPGAGGVQYRGVTTWAQLYGISPSFRGLWRSRPVGDAGRTEVRWRLWVDDSGLPNRLTTETAADLGGKGKAAKLVVDTRYTGWGSPADVASPAERIFGGKDADPQPPLDTTIHGASES